MALACRGVGQLIGGRFDIQPDRANALHWHAAQEHGNDRQRISNIAFFFCHRAFYRAG